MSKTIKNFLKEEAKTDKATCRCCTELSTSLIDIATRKKIPLKFMSYDIEIADSLAYICLNQEYFNDSANKIETEFYFSVGNNTCFYDFEATIDNIVIKGQIKEKEIAKEEYKENLKKGNVVAYSEIVKDAQDVLKINVGNIPAKTAINIKFKYLQELEICMNKFWRLTIPSTIGPKYHSKHQASEDPDMKNLENLKQIQAKDPEVYKWSIKAIINSSSPISFLRSPSHEIITEFPDKTKNKCITSFKNEEIPNKDFTILYKNDEMEKSHWMLEHTAGDDEYPFCSMFSFFPQFNNATDNDAYEVFLKNSVKNTYKISALKSKGEFIFVLDRSGSMSGKRIEMAKQALILFLKSMPPDSFFNVLSFGDRFSFLSKNKQKYSEENIKNAIKQIEGFSADMGGTEIFDGLKAVFKQESLKNYPLNIFLLTDGDVSDTNRVIELIHENNEKCRTYTIGIGNGCSRDLIVQGAVAGNGKYEFIADNEDMNAKIIGLLQDSLTPFLTDINIEFDKEIVEIITPLPENMGFIRKNEPLRFFAFFNKKFNEIGETKIKLSYTNSLKNERQVEEIHIQKNDLLIQQDFIHRYATYQLLELLIKNIKYDKDIYNDLYLAKKKDIETYSLKLALKYQILTVFTAFICVIKERDPNDDSKFIIKKEIPSIRSVDYSMNLGLNKEEDECWGEEYEEEENECHPVFNCMDMEFTKEDMCEAYNEREDKWKGFLNFEYNEKNDLMATKSNPFEEIIEKSDSNENKELLMKILSEQKIGGYWDMNVISLISSNKEEIFKSKPNEILSKEIWITIFILTYLELKFPINEGSWKLISQKGMEYLEDNGIDYSNYRKKAIDLIK